jgi:hypothetical protein
MWLQVERRGFRWRACIKAFTASPSLHGLSPDGLLALLLGNDAEPSLAHVAPKSYGSLDPSYGGDGYWSAFTHRGLERELDKRVKGWRKLDVRAVEARR